MRKAISVIGLGLLMAGCAKPQAPIAPQAEAAKELPVICRLVSREQTVTISAGPNGAVYSVQSADGKTLLANADRAELRRQFPVLSHQLDSAIVGFAGIARD